MKQCNAKFNVYETYLIFSKIAYLLPKKNFFSGGQNCVTAGSAAARDDSIQYGQMLGSWLLPCWFSSLLMHLQSCTWASVIPVGSSIGIPGSWLQATVTIWGTNQQMNDLFPSSFLCNSAFLINRSLKILKFMHTFSWCTFKMCIFVVFGG